MRSPSASPWVDDALCERYASKPDRTITSGLPTRTPFKLCIGGCFHLPSQVLAETELFIMQRASRSTSVSVWACDGLRWPIGEHCFERATEPILIKALVAWVHMIAVFAHEVAAPVRPAAVGVAKRVLLGQPPGAEDAA